MNVILIKYNVSLTGTEGLLLRYNKRRLVHDEIVVFYYILLSYTFSIYELLGKSIETCYFLATRVILLISIFLPFPT